MHKTIRRVATCVALCSSAFAMADEPVVPASAAGAEAAPAPLAPQPYSLWKNVAFEVGFGHYFTQEDMPVEDRALGYTLGLGHRVGRGVVMLRYSYHTTEDAINEVSEAAFCGIILNKCVMQEVKQKEFSVMYRERPWTFLSWGLGVGMVRRTLEEERRVRVTGSEYRVENTDVSHSERGALFYELMLQFPVSRAQRMSIGLGLQGQYNSDFPANAFVLSFQKGL